MFSQQRHNFLHAKALHHRPRKWRPVVKVFAVLGCIALVLALLGIPLFLMGDGAYRNAMSGKADLEQARVLAEKGDFENAKNYSASAEAKFAAARSSMGGLLFFRGLPWAGPYITTADRLLVSGESATHAMTDLLDVASRLTAVFHQSEGLSANVLGSLPDAAKAFKELTPEQKREVLANLAESAPQMRDALASIDQALLALDAVPVNDVAPEVAATIAPLRAQLPLLRQTLTLALPVAEYAPSVLGYPDARRYLVFFQNNTELRPTGGFLGVYGLATVQDADLVEFTTDDIYSLDGPAEAGPRPAPPAPIRKYIGIEKWFLRDANWSPDFVASSSLMAQFFQQEHEFVRKTPAPRIDGVIAIDTEVAKDVLRITGPITVQDKTFTPDNVVDTLEFAVERGFVEEGISVENRKQIVAELVRAVIAKLEAMPLQQLLASLEVAKRNLNEGHVLLSMRDPALENAILDRDWGGVLRPVRGDYLMWVDANLASLKSDPAVQRTLSYRTAYEDGQMYSYAKMTYKHVGRFDWKTTRYRTYARIFVPNGSELVSVSGAMENDRIKDPARRPGTADKGTELGRTWFGAFVSIEPGETRTLEFRYKMAQSVQERALVDREYALDVEKQSGTVAHGLTVDLDFGNGAGVRNAVPAEAQSNWGDNRYQISTDLRTDRAFDVEFHPAAQLLPIQN